MYRTPLICLWCADMTRSRAAPDTRCSALAPTLAAAAGVWGASLACCGDTAAHGCAVNLTAVNLYDICRQHRRPASYCRTHHPCVLGGELSWVQRQGGEAAPADAALQQRARPRRPPFKPHHHRRRMSSRRALMSSMRGR